MSVEKWRYFGCRSAFRWVLLANLLFWAIIEEWKLLSRIRHTAKRSTRLGTLLSAPQVGQCPRMPIGRVGAGIRHYGCSVLVIMVTLAVQVHGSTVTFEDLGQRYHGLLLLQPEDYQTVDIAIELFEKGLIPRFQRQVRNATSHPYTHRGVHAYFGRGRYLENDLSKEELTARKANSELIRLITVVLPTLAYAYNTPGPQPGDSPYYHNDEVLALYVNGLDYCYSRGITETAWLPDSTGKASRDALRAGLVRPSGDLSGEVRNLGGFIQSIFLMREPLARLGLLDRYRGVMRNLSINNGLMFDVFSGLARAEVVVGRSGRNPNPNHLNADGIRLFVDYFMPYFFLVEDRRERDRLTAILMQVIAANIAIKPGVQDTIKPDGTGFHHATAYVGAYTPFAFEVMAQLLYLLKGTGYYRSENIETLKFALESFRVMVQKYTMSTALKGRIIGMDGARTSAAVAKGMAFLGHPEGLNDADMRSRFAEFFDHSYFDEKSGYLFGGLRGVPIRGFGILRLIDDLEEANIRPAKVPTGVWVKPYAAAAFFRRDNWLITAKGFSQYFWDYEGPLPVRQNSFGQNWSYGSLLVFSAGDPVSEQASGHRYSKGWDWYHIPGTTATHYPITCATEEAVKKNRTKDRVIQKSLDRNFNSKTFVGGVSIGNHGLFVQDLEAVPFNTRTDLRARKSYFFVGDKVLALGTHISGGTLEDETHTTVFQTYLESSEVPTAANGKRLTGLETSVKYPAGSSVAMTDGVGNSYFLTSSTSDLFLSRSIQQSMTTKCMPTEGAVTKAYLNHGISPRVDSYQYVVIPADPDGLKLQVLARNPSDYYHIHGTGEIHIAQFPAHGVTGYAFYKIAETPAGQLVKRVDVPAAVMVQQELEGVKLAVSVPDIGWRLDGRLVSEGNSFGAQHFARQKAKEHTLTVLLRGSWRLAEEVIGVRLNSEGFETTLEFICTDGLSSLVHLLPVE